jgi:hypothetical protein
MWTCAKCGRIFEKAKQPHSCHKVPLEAHFKNKDKARELFDWLVKQLNKKIGKCKVISIPCCIHLFGSYDFLAVLPKKDKLEIRFGLDRKLDSPRLTQSVPVSSKYFKNCIDINNLREIDKELIGWLNEAYHLKDKIKET